ncbi:hypothetical protein ACFUIT_03725 [Streptomyces sp. NPDC057239]|uniref:hypothetical protein n=1 Tax=Streptomyces sp. NPDC057239 TaxID=3346061 RepID=UPI003636C0EB
MSEEARPLTAEEWLLMLRVLACLRDGLVRDSQQQRPDDEASPSSARALSMRVRELNRWSSHQGGLR